MKRFVKSFAYILVMISVATMVSGCSSKSSTESEKTRPFVIWSFEDADIWAPTIKQIKKKLGEGVEVTYVKKKLSSSYESDALNSILSDQGPDIWAIPNDWVYRHKDKLTAMPASTSDDIEINIDENFVPAIKESCMIGENIYALSPYMDTLRIYYNPKLFQQELDAYYAANDSIKRNEEDKAAYKKTRAKITELLEQPPMIWSDFVETVKLLTKRDGANISQSGAAIGTADNVNKSTEILYSLMLQNGTKMTSEDLKLATFSLPEETSSSKENTPAKRAVDFYTSFANPSSPNYSWNATMPDNIEAFVQGKTAMIISYGSLKNRLDQDYPSFKYKTSVLPQIGDNQTNVIDYGSFTTLSVPIPSPFSKVAWNTIKELATTSDFPSTLGITSSQKKKSFDALLSARGTGSSGVNNQTQTAHTWAKGRYPVEIDNIFKAIISKTNSEPASSQAFIDNAAIQATDLLKKSDW